MGLSHAQHGLSSFGMPVIPGLLTPITGHVFFVSSAVPGSNSYDGKDPDRPFATINYAISQCVANRGDLILVMPGHAESISGVGAIAANIAGVTILGLGNGANRPTITLHTTTTTIAISAANVTFKNIRIATDVDAVVTVFNITAPGCTLDAVDFVETAACACLQLVLTSAAADDLTIQNCSWVQSQTAATALQQWIMLIGADRFKCFNNFASLKGASASANGLVVGATTLSSDVYIAGNSFISVNSTTAIVISLFTGTTGFVRDNDLASGKTAIAGQCAVASCYAANNLVNNTVDLSGLLDPVVDS